MPRPAVKGGAGDGAQRGGRRPWQGRPDGRAARRRRARGLPAGHRGLAGFWLPAPLRERLIGPDTVWEEATFTRGLRCGAEHPTDVPEAVTARWPVFTRAEWDEIVAGLRAAREKAPRGPEYWDRLQAALNAATGSLADPAGPQTPEPDRRPCPATPATRRA